MSTDANKHKIILDFAEWFSYFNEYYTLLLDRYERFKELRKAGNILDANTYFEMLIVQLRSLMLDKAGNMEKNYRSYTFQNVLYIANDKKATKQLEGLINTVLIPGISECSECLVGYNCQENITDCPVMKSLTLGEGIKIVTDKTICHYDSFCRRNSHKWELIQLIKNQLYDENEIINMDYIIKTLKNIFHEKVQIDLSSIVEALEDL